MAETQSEIEQINAAQRELNLRKAEIMLTQIAAVETLLSSAEGKRFSAKLAEIASQMVDGTSRNTVNNLLSAINSATMSMSFDKSTFENIKASAAE